MEDEGFPLTELLNLLTDIQGLSVGHATDLQLGSGATVIVFDKPAIASGTVLGGAPGGRDTALLEPSMTVGAVDAFVLSGVSASGLDSAGGVQPGLRESGPGLEVGPTPSPIAASDLMVRHSQRQRQVGAFTRPIATWATKPSRRR